MTNELKLLVRNYLDLDDHIFITWSSRKWQSSKSTCWN